MSVNQYPNEGQQKKRSTGTTCLIAGGIGCLVIVLAVVAVGLIGYSKMMKNPKMRGVFHEAKTMSQCGINLALINEGFKKYAADHSGQYPAKLGDLYPKYVTDPKQIQCPTSAQAGVAHDYEYTKPSPAAPESTVVVVCKHHLLMKGQPPMPIKLLKDGTVDSKPQTANPQQGGPAPKPQPVPTKP